MSQPYFSVAIIIPSEFVDNIYQQAISIQKNQYLLLDFTNGKRQRLILSKTIN